MKYKYHPSSRDELNDLVDKLIKERGNNANLNDIDTSGVTNMSWLFVDTKFNGDISNWDVSNVTNMVCMFMYSKFNGDISKWNVSNVTDMSYMFDTSKFTRVLDIMHWNITEEQFNEMKLMNIPYDKLKALVKQVNYNESKFYKLVKILEKSQ